MVTGSRAAWRCHGGEALLVAALVASCVGCSDASRSGPSACLASRDQALFNGRATPTEIVLSPGEREAIGLIEYEEAGFGCTGTLIRPQWVLTASHCDEWQSLRFVSSNPDIPPIVIDRTVVHDTLDLMLVRLAVDSTATPLWVRAHPLDEAWLGRDATLAGTGVTEEGTFGELLFVTEPVVALWPEIVVDGSGRTGACAGDSGGPLLVPGLDGRPEIAGVLSYGDASCLGRDYYTPASHFDAWIEEVAGPVAESPCRTR